ncbi:hypothetical protein Ade02nite_19660 [Paractinoplanes deccanensis]|uniref:Uncharacterized protein n=1 Tax=Paractinoplanes deccanensis TaxID=113561 RepID=A0ABQ3Y036_9ACTN|nr:hypothetical protein [Actinoplanes deccanensis]GID73325.1 hypothetical protein Ade02nite_19660 [Actinoplanes deccanensis]
MARQRPSLGTPFGTDGPWLQAIVDALGDIHDLLDARLPQRVGVEAPVEATEPAPDSPPVTAVPVSEPAPDRAPAKPEPVKEPDPDDEPVPGLVLPPPPPRSGRGSGLPAWQAWADLARVEYDEDASRDDVIAACELAGVISDGRP